MMRLQGVVRCTGSLPGLVLWISGMCKCGPRLIVQPVDDKL